MATLNGKAIVQIPETLGAVVIFYNIPEVGNVSLKFTGAVLADIWSEKITMWNDPAITALNPGIALPDKPITPVHRSDGSGTTYAFTHYLSQVDPTWNSTIGVGLSVNWPTENELASRGSAGVAGLVYATPYSIGYVDQYYAQHNNLPVAQVQNSAGNFITPTLASISSAASDFATQLSTDPTFTITNAPGATSYPISTFTYLLVWKDQTDYNMGYAIANFFWWIVHQGQPYAPVLYFPILPSNIVTIDEGLIKQINYNGQSLVSPSLTSQSS
jgi:phosphate ABC transporter phosphate-binding protein